MHLRSCKFIIGIKNKLENIFSTQYHNSHLEGAHAAYSSLTSSFSSFPYLFCQSAVKTWFDIILQSIKLQTKQKKSPILTNHDVTYLNLFMIKSSLLISEEWRPWVRTMFNQLSDRSCVCPEHVAVGSYQLSNCFRKKASFLSATVVTHCQVKNRVKIQLYTDTLNWWNSIVIHNIKNSLGSLLAKLILN